MVGMVWEAGRLAWAPVVVVAYAALCLVLLDLAWRLARMPFRRLALLAAVAALAGAVFLGLLAGVVDGGSGPAVLVLQLALLAVAAVAVVGLVWRWPHPSPLIGPLLPPRRRWPTDLVKEWVESQGFAPAFVRFFNRDPERTVPPGDGPVAPADGVVKDIVARAGTTYFVVGLSFWDVHVVRTPLAGRVTGVEIQGVSLFRDRSESHEMAWLDGKAGPVQAVIDLATATGPIRLRLITSWSASRLKVSAIEGQELARGQRVGRIQLGSTVVVDFPGTPAFTVAKGDRVVAGETVIAAAAVR